MKLNRDDEYYKLIYNWVDSLDFIIGYEFLEAKSPNTDAFNHMHMEIKCAGGDITLRVDANGVMITCGCGCMGMDELDYFQVCETQKQLNQLIESQDKPRAPWSNQMYPPDNEWDRQLQDGIQDLFKRLNEGNSDESRIDRDLKRLTNSIDKIFTRIDNLDIEKREEYLIKLKEVLGTKDE